jgi:hypothetical protein
MFLRSDSCDNWLHGRCVNKSKRDIVGHYICVFCIEAPDGYDGRGRLDGRRGSGVAGLPGSSPLAHKSLRSFR